MSAVPVLQTERLVLRAHTVDDFPAMAALWADPEVVRHIGGVPFDEEAVWSRLLRYAGHWQVIGFGWWAAEERATGRYAGDVGFFDLRRALTPSLGRDPEGGWMLAPWAQGRGLATEAMRAALAWLGPRRSVCIIDPDNHASVRVATKLGYRALGTASYHGAEVRTFERLTST